MSKLLSAAALAMAALAALSPRGVDAHGYLTLPVGRAQAIWGDTKGNQNCRVHTQGNVTEFQAGEVIQVRHTRNNHVGGFIRYAISPLGNETTADFDSNAFYYTCREAGAECHPKNNATTRYAQDGAAAYVVQCGDTITLPDWLPAGDYVLQWTWFGVGVSYGNLGRSEPQFRSCADIRLTTSGTKPRPACPTFVGGDRVTKLEGRGSDVCLYFHANDIVDSIFETSDYESEYKFGIPARVEKCRAAAQSSSDDDAETPAPSSASPVPTSASHSGSDASDDGSVAGDDDSETPVATPPPSPTATPSPSSASPAPTSAPMVTPKAATDAPTTPRSTKPKKDCAASRE